MSRKPKADSGRNLDTLAKRRVLKQRGAPYSERLGKGVALLLYVGRNGHVWKSRTPIDGDRVIGPAAMSDVDNGMTFEAAQAEVWSREAAEKVPQAPKVERARLRTLGEIWEAYETWAANTKTGAAMTTIRVHGRHIEPLFSYTVANLSLEVLNEWALGLIEIGQKPQTANKAIGSLKAALNRAGLPGDWQELPKFKEARPSKPEAVFTAEELRLFLGAAHRVSQAFGQFCEALALTGARPGEMQQVRVSDVSDTILQIRQGKTGPRPVVLTTNGRVFFNSIAAGREKDELLFSDGSGSAWTKDTLRRPFARAVADAELCQDATPYVLRHTFITLAIYSSMNVFNVAKHCGTSVAMIERTYGHTLAEMQADALAAIDAKLDIGGLRVVEMNRGH